MSGMEVEIAIRFDVSLKDTNGRELTSHCKEWFDECVKVFGKLPDDHFQSLDSEDHYMNYFPESNKLWTVNFAEGKPTFDKVFSAGLDPHGFDFNLDKSEFSVAEAQLGDMLKGSGIVKVSSGRLKVMYYYNGGCAGICEQY